MTGTVAWDDLARVLLANLKPGEARATIARVGALIDTWHASPDLRTRAHADRLSEALDGRPRA